MITLLHTASAMIDVTAFGFEEVDELLMPTRAVKPIKAVTRIYFLGVLGRDLRRFEFESAVPIRFDSDGPNFRIGRVCPLLVVVRRLKPLTALSDTVYRLASSMSDHTPVLFNVFEPFRIGMRNL